MTRVQRIAVLGSTGSIGMNTLDVVERHQERFRITALCAGSNVARLREQCLKHVPKYAVLADAKAAERLRSELAHAGLPTYVLTGAAALEQVAADEDVDIVMAAIVGAAGLRSSLAAARSGKRILLANKEALVMSGPLFMDAVRAGGATLIPVDSEHSAILQCLPARDRVSSCGSDVRRILLTASGGPFLRATLSTLHSVTPEQACAHPRWSMGRKISVDSATLMNKGLELIEASLLFDVPPEKIEVVVHPQSIVHSMVEYLDGSVMAQLGSPDMRTPISLALAWPDRLTSGVESLDIIKTGRLEFEAPDLDRFPALRLAREAACLGGTAPTVLNAANEVAVQAFLAGDLAFMRIPEVIERVLAAHRLKVIGTLDDVFDADRWARERALVATSTATGAIA